MQTNHLFDLLIDWLIDWLIMTNLLIEFRVFQLYMNHDEDEFTSSESACRQKDWDAILLPTFLFVLE